MTNRSQIYLRNAFVPLLLVVAVSTGTAAAQFQGAAPAQNAPAAQPVLIERGAAPDPAQFAMFPGDSFQMQVYNVPKMDFHGRLDESGSVSIPLIGSVHLAGLSVVEAERLLEKTLKEQQLINDPQVAITVLESPDRLATITGEVKNPGSIQIYGEKHLLDVISSAGGLTPAASQNISIYRRGRSDAVQIYLGSDAAALSSANIRIAPGDTIVVPKVGVVYVIGATHVQGAIPLKNSSPLTLIQALSLAGGVNFEAARGKARLLRVNGDGRTEIAFDVTRLLNEQSKEHIADMVLQNDDIILIPTSQMKAALKGGAASVAAGLVAGIGYMATAH